MSNPIFNKSSLYQSANAENETIRSNFIVRIHEFEIVKDDLLRGPSEKSTQHYLFLGRRGSGKSTLLKRIQVEIEEDDSLRSKYITVNLAEEQANIYKLYDLVEEIISELEHQSIYGDAPKWDDDAHVYTKNLLKHLHQLVHKSGRQVVLLLDNIDRIFENIQEDASLLREHLLNFNDLKIIGGSTRMTEHFWKYEKPFYQFFLFIPIDELSSEEVRALLLDWSKKLNLPKLKTFVKNHPGRLEAIRILTDGLPRTLHFFVNILLTKTQESTYDYLRQVMDSVTPLYQERLNTLPPSQRKIILQMAFLWEAAGAAAIGKVAKMTNSVISAQLKQLADKGLVEKIQTGNKNHLYRLSERFFNLWLIFTQGSPHEKRKARYLTIFLENFYDEEEIFELVNDHLEQLESKSVDPNRAALMTKALAQSKYISSIVRDTLIENTLNIKNISRDLIHQLPRKTITVLREATQHIQQGNFKKVQELLSTIEQDDGFHEFVVGTYHQFHGHLIEAKKAYITSIDKGYELSSKGLAVILEQEGNHDEAEKYYRQFLEITGDAQAYFFIATREIERKSWADADIHFDRAIELEPELVTTVALEYLKVSKYEEANKHLIQAATSGLERANLWLALLLYVQNKRPNDAREYLEKEKELFGLSRNFDLLKILISAWTGHLKNIKDDAILFITEQIEDSFNQSLLRGLLLHSQTNLVYEIFSLPDIGPRLKEKFLPLYYATRTLATGEKDIKMPPELSETVDKLIIGITNGQGFFSNPVQDG